jgi:hypothetical protein
MYLTTLLIKVQWFLELQIVHVYLYKERAPSTEYKSFFLLFQPWCWGFRIFVKKMWKVLLKVEFFSESSSIWVAKNCRILCWFRIWMNISESAQEKISPIKQIFPKNPESLEKTSLWGSNFLHYTFSEIFFQIWHQQNILNFYAHIDLV